MYNTAFSRNPWGESDQPATLEELRKSIREQKVLLAATAGINEDEVDAYNDDHTNKVLLSGGLAISSTFAKWKI